MVRRAKQKTKQKHNVHVPVTTGSSKQNVSLFGRLSSHSNIITLPSAVVTLALTSPLILDRYVYTPKVLWRTNEPQEAQGMIQLLWSAKNIGSKTATNIRVTVMTPNAEKTIITPSLRVASRVTKERRVAAVDIPSLPPGETIDVMAELPPELYHHKNGGNHLFFIVSVTADNTTPAYDPIQAFKFFRPDEYAKK